MSSDEDYYYQGEQDDFDALNTYYREELPGVNEYEPETSFDEWEEEVPFDAQFDEELKKQQLNLQRKEDELEKISQVISKKAELLKLENEEMQCLHNLKVQQRILDVTLKLGDNWDRARRMFGLPQKGTNNDHDFLHILDSYKSSNPDNSLYMEAPRIENSRIVAGFDKVRDEMAIYIYCQQEVSL